MNWNSLQLYMMAIVVVMPTIMMTFAYTAISRAVSSQLIFCVHFVQFWLRPPEAENFQNCPNMQNNVCHRCLQVGWKLCCLHLEILFHWGLAILTTPHERNCQMSTGTYMELFWTSKNILSSLWWSMMVLLGKRLGPFLVRQEKWWIVTRGMHSQDMPVWLIYRNSIQFKAFNIARNIFRYFLLVLQKVWKNGEDMYYPDTK